MNPSTFALVINPRTRLGPCGPLVGEALGRLRQRGRVEVMETSGDGGDQARIAALIGAAQPALVLAAGGDGTVCDVAAALHATAPAVPLAILPLGTANNVARSLGLRSVRLHHGAAMQEAVAAALAGHAVPLDLGEADGRCFVGSFAIGMDAAILATRNRWRSRFALGRRLGGYPLYLLSCAVNLARQRAVAGGVRLDGQSSAGAIYNLLITNTALYAGEFRFDARGYRADGKLDVHVFASPADYVRGFVTAWRRHVHEQRGEDVTPPPGLRRAERIEIALSRPIAAQLDGEEAGRAERFAVRVLPAALRVRCPL